jgi:protein-S-isoprenylcysteine O-methyltransferase Ste14
MLEISENLISLLAKLCGGVAILLPLVQYMRADKRLIKSPVTEPALYLRWPVIILMTAGFVILAVVLWKPIPLQLSTVSRFSMLVIGACLYFPGVLLYLWGFFTLGRMFGISSSFGASLYPDHELIQDGPYKLLRHPMYLGVILAGVGALLLFRTWAMLLFAPMTLSVVLRARREEVVLNRKFDQAWKAYCQRVPAWWPRLIGK